MNKKKLIGCVLFCFFLVSNLSAGNTDIVSNIGTSKEVAESHDLTNFPKGADPKEIGIKLTERYIRTIDTQAPHVNYPYVCTWLGAYRFTQTIKDDNLYNRLLDTIVR